MTEKQRNAAELVAIGTRTIKKIAEMVGVSERTLHTWKQDAAFAAEVSRLWRERARAGGMSDPDLRLRSLHDLDRRLASVMKARAKDPGLRTVPGGNTGLITVTYKMLSRMDNTGEKPVRVSEPVPEYAVDTGFVAEMRAVKQQIAIETGQWKPKTLIERRAPHEAPLAVAMARVLTLEQIEELEQKLLAIEAEAKP